MTPEQQRHEYISRHVEAMRTRFKKGYMASLQPVPRWVAWSKETDEIGNTHKVPRNPVSGYNASLKKPESWGTLEQALRAYESGRYDGIGVYLLAPFVLVDMDNSFNPATRRIEDERAERIISLLNSYTEVSPRKKGLHAIIAATPPGENFRIEGLEVYTNWFSTVTTWHVPGTPVTIEMRQEELEVLYQQFTQIPRPERVTQNTGGVAGLGIRLTCRKRQQTTRY